MKMNVIYDKRGDVAAALHAEPQKLADGRQVLSVFRLQNGQSSRLVEVTKNLKGTDLLKHIASLPRPS
jgi:hypothetical protein